MLMDASFSDGSTADKAPRRIFAEIALDELPLQQGPDCR